MTRPLLRIVDNGASPSLAGDCRRVVSEAMSALRQKERSCHDTAWRGYRQVIERLPELDAFVAAFGEWVEACWFAEHDRAPGRLEAVLAFPPDVVLVGALWVLRRLLELSDPRGLAPPLGDAADVGAALADHLLITGP